MVFQLINLLLLLFINDIYSCEFINQLLQNNSDEQKEKISKNIWIRVLLDEMDGKKDNPTWKILDSKAFGLIIRTRTYKKKVRKIEIKRVWDKFYLNEEPINEKILRIETIGTGHLKFNDKEFQGLFFLINENNKLLLINRVELEDYIYAVLFTESWPGWPLEVNKAFAIASRSYVIAKFLENKEKTKKYYHVHNTNKHQTYYGIHKIIKLRKAVEETKSIVLGYNKKPILAMFDSCCGGIIPADMMGVNFCEVPYLKRKEQCLFCKSCKIFSWNVEYTEEEFLKVLKKELPKLNDIKTISIIKDKALVAHKIIIKDKKNKVFNLTGKKFYSLFDKIKSFSFSIDKKKNKILITGKGYGHHLGICQWGAREMINQGWDYKSILAFYYPYTNFMKLS